MKHTPGAITKVGRGSLSAPPRGVYMAGWAEHRALDGVDRNQKGLHQWHGLRDWGKPGELRVTCANHSGQVFLGWGWGPGRDSTSHAGG